MPSETVIEIEGDLKFNSVDFPQMQDGNDIPPPESKIEMSCEDENALIDAWFTSEADKSGFPPPAAKVTRFLKGQPFLGTIAGMDFNVLVKSKLVLRNNGTSQGRWAIRITLN